MLSAGAAAAGASADASEGSWPCPKCTFLNKADITLCDVCQLGRPYSTAGAGKGKGRAGLRPRSNLCPPRSTLSPKPPVSSFPESHMEKALKAEKDGDIESGSDLALAMASQASKRPRRSARRVKRARGLETNVKENDNPAAPATSLDDTGGSVAAANAAIEAVTGVQDKPVELDDSDQGEGFGGESGAYAEHSSEYTRDDSEEDWGEDDEELLGETPSLFGRGWSADDRKRAEERRNRARERDIAGAYGGVGRRGSKRRGGGSSTRRGPKPGQLCEPYPGDDIFRARKYPVSDEENPDDKPLVLNRRGGFTGDVVRPFWRWPPPPPLRDGTVAGAPQGGDVTESCSAEDSVDAGDGRLPAVDSEERQDSTQVECGTKEDRTGGRQEEGSSNSGDPIKVEHISAETPPLEFPQQQGQRPKKRRARLSLPKRPENDPQEPTPAAAAAISASHPASSTAIHTDQSSDELGKDISKEVRNVDKAGNGLSHTQASDEMEVLNQASESNENKLSPGHEMAEILGSGESGVEESKGGNSRGGGLDAVNTKSDEEDISSSASDQGERVGDVRAPGSPGGQSPRETAAESSVAVDVDASGRAITSSSRTHKVMLYEGLDDDSTDSEEPQEDDSAGGRPKQLGRAVESSVTDAALKPAASSSPNISAVASNVDGIDPIPDPETPSKKPGKREDRLSGKDSPDPLSACLVDTPPPVVTKTEGKRLAARKASQPKMKLSRSSMKTGMLDDAPPPGSATREQWACPRCTLLNRARAPICDACRTANPALAPSSKRITRQSSAMASGKTAADRSDSDDDGAAGDLGSSGDRYDEGFPADDPTAGNSDSALSNASDVNRSRADSREYEEGGGNKDPSQGKGIAGSTRTASHANVSVYPDWRVGDEASGKRRGCNARGVEVFVGNRKALGAGSDEDDCLGIEWGGEAEAEEGDFEEHEDDCDVSDDYEDADWDGSEDDTEVINSQIEERFTRSSQRNIPPRKRQRPHGFHGEEPGEICDLTGVPEDGGNAEGEDGARDPKWSRVAALEGNLIASTHSMLEEISDDDEVVADLGPRRRGVGSVSLRDPSGQRKFRFFEPVSDLRNNVSSSIDFAALEAAPSGVITGAKSYESRKKVRDTMASKSKTKRSKRGEAKKTSASNRVRGAAARAGKVKGKGKGNGAARSGATAASSYVQPFGRGGGVPSASWIPDGVATSLVRSGGASRGRVQRQSFNHYRSSDDLVDESEVGGGMNWESAGRINLGGD